MTDTAADYQAEAVHLAQQTAEYQHATQTATLNGRIFREGIK